MALNQLPRTVGLKATEYGDTFLVPAFPCQLWNIQYPHHIIDGKVYPLAYAALTQSVHKEVVPAPMLCQQEVFKLAAAFSFQLQQHPFFFVGGYQNEDVPHVVMLWIGIETKVLMYHKVQL